MRSLWKGVISFGLVTIPVKLYKATETKEIDFRLLHKECQTPISYRRYCDRCGEFVASDELIRGYEYERGRFVVLGDEDLEQLPLGTVHTIEILDFVPAGSVDPIYFMKSYFVAPGELGSKAYRLLFTVMEEMNRVAVAQVVLRSRENLCLLRTYKKLILLSSMHYAGEIRPAEQVPGVETELPLGDKELSMARTLVESMTTSFEPEKYTNRYREALEELIASRIERREVAVVRPPEEREIIDLVEALRRSVEKVEQGRETKKKRAAR